MCACCAQVFRAIVTEPYQYTSEEAAVDGEAAIARVKANLGWRDDATEAAWMKKHKVSLLLLAIGMNDAAAVKALLAKADAAEALATKAKPLWTKSQQTKKSGNGHRADPFVGMCDLWQDCSPVAMAIGMADLEVLKLVLAARPPPPKQTPKVMMMGMFLGKVGHQKLFAETYPECKLFDKEIFMGMSWTHMYSMAANSHDQSEKLKFYNDRTDNKFVDKYMPLGLKPLHCMTQNPEIDGQIVRDIAAAGADIQALDKVPTSPVPAAQPLSLRMH